MYFIAIDVGSSYIKSVLFEMDNSIVVEKHRIATPAKLPNMDENIFEINAKSILDSVKSIIHNYQSRYNDIEGIVLSTQMHGCVLSDTNYSDDVYVSWQDARSLKRMPGSNKSYMEHLMEIFTVDDMQNTGVYIKPALALCNLYALYHQKDFKIGPGATVYTLGSYLIKNLTGNNICHITNAAPLGMVDITTGSWRKDILEEIGLSALDLPRITNSLECCGYYKVDGQSIPVYPDIGDTQTAVLGCSTNIGDIVVNIGTAGQVMMITDEFRAGNYEVRPFFENLYCNVISRLPSGRNLDILIDFFREAGERIFGVNLKREEVWNRILDGFTLSDPQGLAVDAGFYEMPDRLADGAILHIDRANLTINNVISATLYDIGNTYKKYIDVLSGTEKHNKNMFFCGGAALNNPMLIEAIERATKTKANMPLIMDEVYIGLFRIALLCSRRCKTLAETEERKLKIS